MHQHNITVSTQNYEAARRRAAFLRRSGRGYIVASGADRRSYLHGLLTNDIASLAAGRGCYAAYLTPQGRMIADLFVYELGDILLLAVPLAVKDTVLSRLDQFVFSEDVQLADATAAFGEVGVVGPGAAVALAGATGPSADVLDGLPEHGNVRIDAAGRPVVVVRVSDTGVPGFGVFAEPAHVEAIAAALSAAGVPELDAATAEAIRIESGVPRFGADMDDETIPLEAGIESRAISFTKGCYVGQEVIIRVLHRGHGRVARKLVGLVIDGAGAPPPGASIAAGDRAVGRVTSSSISPALGCPIALGYVHREFVEAGTALTIEGAPARVAALPFARE